MEEVVLGREEQCVSTAPSNTLKGFLDFLKASHKNHWVLFNTLVSAATTSGLVMGGVVGFQLMKSDNKLVAGASVAIGILYFLFWMVANAFAWGTPANENN